MPLPPLPENNTPRMKVIYTVNGEEHSTTIRTGESPASFGTLFDAFMDALAPELYLVTISEVQYAPSGSDIFNAVTTGIEGNTYGSGAGAYEQKAWYIDFIGRSAGGYRVRSAIYGIRTMAGDFRYLAGENASVDAAIAIIQQADDTWLAKDNVKAVWKRYANTGVNAHWQRALRP